MQSSGKGAASTGRRASRWQSVVSVVLVATAMLAVVAFAVRQLGLGGGARQGAAPLGLLLGTLRALRADRGEPFDFKQVPGKPLVVSMFATWCPPCNDELADLQERFGGDSRFEVVAVSAGEELETVQQWAEKKSFRMRVLLDHEGAWAKHLSFDGSVPQLYLFDADGKLLLHEIGYNPETIAELPRLLGVEKKAGP